MTIPAVSLKHRIYRQFRLWHGYLSAFAFIALLFFAATGILLNHPTWFAAERPRSEPTRITLTPAQLQEIRAAPKPAQRLTALLAKQTTLYGQYEEGDVEQDQISLRLRGARGSSDVSANLRDGSVMIVTERATTSGMLNALHRGEHAGAPWRLFIDIAAGILIVLSLLGYGIFFSLISKRLRTALIITGVSAVAIVVFFIALGR
jgi:hypothetical protein